jgi:hypothetical protein
MGMIKMFILGLIALHSIDGALILINPELITSMRGSTFVGKGDKLLTHGVGCLVNLDDGKFVTVLERCDEVTKAIETARDPK